ncbi:uncharacterized protein LOC135175608 [Pogoniulus pusillus]|uniref:uncharacterized protein LOC135175608 n=1 Tax=Pogoniulus pusillus TaxID=488313 RepID=UPI0030B97A1D
MAMPPPAVPSRPAPPAHPAAPPCRPPHTPFSPRAGSHEANGVQNPPAHPVPCVVPLHSVPEGSPTVTRLRWGTAATPRASPQAQTPFLYNRRAPHSSASMETQESN